MSKTPEGFTLIDGQPMEVNQEIVFGMAHLTEECAIVAQKQIDGGDDDWLGKLTIYDNHGFGFRIHAAGAGPLPKTDFPELDKILAFAQKHGFKWVLFDADGPTYANFPIFEWE